MSPLDAESVEHSSNVVGEITERIATVDTLGRAAVARHVRDDDAKVLGQGVDVVRVVRDARCAGPTAVQQHYGRTGSFLGDEDLFTVDAYGAFGHSVAGHCSSFTL